MNENIPKKVKEIKYLVSEFDDNMDEKLYKLIAMSNISRIFDSQQLCDVIGGILSLYGLMIGTVLDDKILMDSLLNEGIRLNAHKIRSKSDLLNHIKFFDVDLNKKFLYYLNSENYNNENAAINIRSFSHIFKDRFSSLEFPIGLIIAFSGVCLCLMCKKLTKYNHFDWVRQKWKAFLGVVGLNQFFSAYGPSYHLMPELKTCRNIYSFFKLHHLIRRQLYLGIMKLSWESGLWGNICRAVLRFSKGLEMDHIVFINTYILQDHPELIHVKELKPEFQKLVTVFKEFPKGNIPEEHWPYIQIVNKYSKDVWCKDDFPMLNYLAVQIGKCSHADLNDYYCKLSSELRDIINRILLEIVEFDSADKIVQDKSDLNLNTVDAADSENANELEELFRISDILEKSLNRLAGVSTFNENDNFDLVSNLIPTTEIKYLRLSNANDDLLKVICLLNISRVYQGECLEEIIGGILSLLTHFDSEILTSDECKISLGIHGFQGCEIPILSADDLASRFVFENDELNRLFLKFCDLASSTSRPIIVVKSNPVVDNLFEKVFLKTLGMSDIYVYIGMCILPIFKQLHQNNYKSWLDHKRHIFSRIAGSPVLPFSLSPTPSLNTCCSIYSFFFSNFELRKIIFLKIYKLLSSGSDLVKSIFSVICHNAKETEMNHIYFINHHIFKERNYILKMKELKPELLRFMRSLDHIRLKIPPLSNWLLFVKLVFHPNEVECLNKKYFPLLLYLAESFHESKDKPRYIGVGKVTEYFKKVEKTVKKFEKIYKEAKHSFDENVQKYFELSYQNGDFLSNLEDEQLKQLTINIELLSASHNQQFGVIPGDEQQQIIEMSIENVKQHYDHHFKKVEVSTEDLISEIKDLVFQMFGGRVTVVDGNEDQRVNEDEEQSSSSEDDCDIGLNEVGRRANDNRNQNSSSEDEIQNSSSKDESQNSSSKDVIQNSSSEDDFNSLFSEFQNRVGDPNANIFRGFSQIYDYAQLFKDTSDSDA